MKKKWTLDLLKIEALKHDTRISFKKNSPGYQTALKMGVLDEICNHMKPLLNSWTDEKLKYEALKYSTRSSFQRECSGGYLSAMRRGILDEICSHMKLLVTRPYTVGEIAIEALKYESRWGFAKHSPTHYNAAWKKGLLDEVCAHMKPSIFAPYSIEELQLEALKYKNRSDFTENSPGAVTCARKKGKDFLDKICSHMPTIKHDYDFGELQEEASKYATRGEFQKKSSNMYSVALRRKILDEICTHMKPSCGSSMDERDLFFIIKGYCPDTRRLRDMKVSIVNRPYIKGFDIDIYIPELKRGIEFDGTYHHSLSGLKRARPWWPEDGIANYHQIKDDYFLSKGIQILHIKEEDWILDKRVCVEKCLKFLQIDYDFNLML